jgi:hypothetical protein
MWTPALPFLWANRLEYGIPNDWRLPGEDFAILGGAYQQNFELSCQALPMLIVAENAAGGRQATIIRVDGESDPWIPSNFPERAKLPRTLAQFKKLNAEAKETFLDQFSITESGWSDAFNRSIRNAIAHADADKVLKTGEIATGKGLSISYMSFVESIIKQLQLLVLWLNLAKLFRIYAFLASQAEAAQTQTS